MANAGRDQNRVTTLIGISSADISAAIPTPVAVDPVTNRLLVSTTGSNGTLLDGVDTGIAATVKDLTNANPLTVAIVDASGDQITTFGGGNQVVDGDLNGDTEAGTLVFTREAGSGASAIIHALRSDGGGNLLVSVQDTVASVTQYEQNAAPSPITGTLAMGLDGANVRAVAVDGNGYLQTEIIGTVTVDANSSSVNVSGSVSVNGQPTVQVAPATSGGLTIFRSIDLDETEEEVKATAGQVYGWYIYNAASSVRYVKLYNATAANVTVGTTTPVMTIPVPATSGANVEFTNGIAFSTAITAAATTGVADSDTSAPGANEVIINLLYS